MAEQMTWTNEPIERLPQFSPYLKNFNALVEHEGGPANVFPGAMRCIDLDAYEKGLKKGIHNPTVDAVIGVFSGKISELVLVELRLNYKNADNLSPTKLKKKVSCSKDILSGCGKLHPIVYFVFNDHVQSLARSWLARAEKGRKKHFKAITIPELNQLISRADS
mgnify:FL=1|jgi:hypothetical protein